MTQQLSPWLETAYGWAYGENGWNTGMDENLLQFSFMFDKNIDGIVSSLPAVVNGTAYFLTTDNRIYFGVSNSWYSTPTPKWFTLFLRASGESYQFNGTSLIPVASNTDLSSQVQAIQVTLSSLGTASLEDVDYFASAAQLDVASAQANNYTDQLRSDLLSPTLGAGLVGIGSTPNYPEGTVGSILQHNPLTEDLTVLVPTDYPTLQAAMDFCSTKRGAKGFSIEVLIESGYVIPGGYRVDDVDLSHVVLSSVDAEVNVSPSFTHIETYNLPAGVARGNFFSFVHVRSKAPRWNILVNHAAAETDGGYCLYWSEGYVYNFKGVKNADHPTEASGEGGAGFKVGGASHLIAPYAIATNCGIGFAITQSTVADIQFANASNCRLTGIDCSRNAIVYALSSKVNGCLREGFYIRRSRVIAETAEIKNCPIGIRTQATSQVSAVNAIFDGTPIAIARGSESTVEITGAMKDGTLLSGQLTALSPQTINALDNNGYTSSSDKVKGNAGQLTAQYTAQGTAGGTVSAPPAAYTVLHTLTGSSREIMSGTIYGHNIGMRITIDGVVALNITVNQSGSDSAGNGVTILTIPPFASKDSFIIEVYNRDASATKSVGWNVYRRV